MTEVSPRYADWKAPAEDGQTLVWPEPPALLADARDNAARLRSANHSLLQGVPLPDVRARARAFIGHEGDAPLVATGHQTELYHPGVWVKNALIDVAAAKLGGQAYHFAVDSDAPKHLHVRWPGGSRPITDDDRLNTAAWSGLLEAPAPAYIERLRKTLAEESADWSFTPVIGEFLDSLRRQSLETPGLPAAVTNATHELDWSLGLRHHAMLTSPLWLSEPYLVYLHHILAQAGPFASAYNAALGDYRERNAIKTTARPMPNLRASTDAVESPFWLDDLAGGERDRVFVAVTDRGTQLRLASGATFTFSPSAEGWSTARQLGMWCRRHQVRLAPRALTLTMFFRLMLADQFVHGIGGGRYDQVTDDVIARFFQIDPPRFAVTTATLYFPAAVGQRRINLRPLFQEGRRIRHGMLSKEKMAAVAQIDRLPRRSRERRELFFDMHRQLNEQSNSPAIRDWEDRLRAAEHESLRQKALFDRELFVAIQPRDRLEGMVERYRAAFG
jgi:hypothetical protein